MNNPTVFAISSVNYIYFSIVKNELKEHWCVVIGYLPSHYDIAKTGFLIYGIPHTGKSVLCNLIERFYGGKNVSHVDISMFNRPEFVAQYIEMDDDSWVSTKELRKAYESYCMANGIVRNRKLDILTYVQSHLGVAKEKGCVKDADGEEHNWWHFKGMKLLWDPEEIEDEADEDDDGWSV